MKLSDVMPDSVKTTATVLVVFSSIIFVVSIAVAVFANGKLENAQEHWEFHHGTVVPKVEALEMLRGDIGYGGLVHHFKNYILRGEETYANRARESYQHAGEAVKKYLSTGVVTADERLAMKEFETVMAQYIDYLPVVNSKLRDGVEPRDVDSAVKISDKPAIDALNQLDVVLRAQMASSDAELTEAWHGIHNIMKASSMAVILMSLGLAAFFFLFARKVIDQLGAEPRELVKLAADLRAGRLLSVISADQQGQSYAEQNEETVKGAVCASARELANVLKKIQVSADTLQAGASEIAESQVALSTRAEQQASSLEQSNDSLGQMTAAAKHTESQAQKAKKITSESREQANTTGSVVAEAVESMGAMADSSQKIADINGVIDEIAFQTNLLALNAAVEAARAGENGRGFAVVATEVRNLAQRSSQAAKEIKVLIDESVQRAQTSADTVNRAGSEIQIIKSFIEDVDNLVAEIADANQSQTAGIHDINDAVSQLNKFTRENASIVEENSTASTRIREETRSLYDNLAYFEVDAVRQTASPSISVRSEQPVRAVHKPVAATPASPVRTEPKVSVESNWSGEERRSADRPWSGQPAGASKSSLSAGSTSKAAGGEDWSHF